jgi:hypothetical protein
MNELGALAMLRFIEPMLVILPMMLWVLLIGPLLVYPLARWKLHKEQLVDPQVGMKVALHYFRLIALHTVLLGALILVWTVISSGGSKGDAYRAAFGLLVPGGIVLGLHGAFLKWTNDAQLVHVRRLFLGYNLIVTGLLGFTAVVLASQAVFAKGSSGNTGRLFFAGVLVYGGAWVALGMQFGRLVLGDFHAAGGPPGSMMPPPSAMPPGHSASGGPVLPPLSAGSFPPIEPKA